LSPPRVPCSHTLPPRLEIRENQIRGATSRDIRGIAAELYFNCEDRRKEVYNVEARLGNDNLVARVSLSST
jgi:hypothetical protein